MNSRHTCQQGFSGLVVLLCSLSADTEQPNLENAPDIVAQGWAGANNAICAGKHLKKRCQSG